MEGPLFCSVVNYDLESVVEADGEVVQVIVESLSAHVEAEAEFVASPVVGGGKVGIAAEQVDIDIHGDVLVERVVQTGDDGETKAGEVVAIVGGDVSSGNVVGTLKMESDVQLSLAEDGEVLPVGHIVAEIGGNVDGGLAGSAGHGGGVVGVGVASIGSGVVVSPTHLNTDLHVVVQLIANFRGNLEVVGGGATDIVVGMNVGMVGGDVSSNNPLGVGGECECCESNG